MIKQTVNIVNFKVLYEILNEIKDNLSFTVISYEKDIDFLQVNKNVLKDSLIITNSNNKNLGKKNLLIFEEQPLSLKKVVELININLIKLKFNFQSKININGYALDLNSKTFFKNNINLKLTEKEIEIILYLNKNGKKHNIQDLQKNIWKYSSDLETHTVETHIYRLRKKINDKFNDNNFIVSHEEGYSIK